MAGLIFEPSRKRTMWADCIKVSDPGTRSLFLELQETEYWTDYIVGGVFAYVVTEEIKLFHFEDALTLLLMLWAEADMTQMRIEGFQKVKDPFR